MFILNINIYNMAIYGVTGSATYSITYNSLDEMLASLPNNNRQQIGAQEVRNSIFTIWNNIGASSSFGFQGVSGNQGSQGMAGATGSIGNQGFQGIGGTGSDGTQGFQGRQGLIGATGAGTSGNQGFQGLQGFQGRQGLAGLTGPSSFDGLGATGFVPIYLTPFSFTNSNIYLADF
jgi:hypothetical protein